MRPRAEALLAVLLLALVAVIGGLLGRAAGEPPDTDPRPSTFLTGPRGSRGLLDAARRLGIEVRRFRYRPNRLEELPDSGRQLFAILDPSTPFSPPEVGAVLRLAERSDLLLAGEGAGSIMRCFGYSSQRRFDSLRVAPPGREPEGNDVRVGRVLIRTGQGEVVDSSRLEDVGRFSCRVPPAERREVFLQGPRSEIAAVRLRLVNGREVIIFSDAAPFRNRNLRHTSAGPLVLGLLAGRYDRVTFDEYHHGFGPGGSLAGAALGWSRSSPLGWGVWQLGLVGLAALLFGAIRFGPARHAITRARRSPLEHVRALATALSASGGHAEAIAAMVKGLRRRLAPAGVRPGGDWREWLAGLDPAVRSERARAALAALRSFAGPGQSARNVRLAAQAVEDLWQELKP